MAQLILYADDDLDDFYILSKAFEGLLPEFRLVHALSGEIAIEYLGSLSNKDSLGLIILDYNMPGMDGVTTGSMIRERHLADHIPIVIFSTSTSYNLPNTSNSYNFPKFKKPYVESDMQKILKVFANLATIGIS